MESKRLHDVVFGNDPSRALRFIEATRGPRSPQFGSPADDLELNPMPRLLRSFYEFAGQWPGLYEQNHLLPPVPASGDPERLVFYELPGVCEWATVSLGDDPPVWFREPSVDSEPGYWNAERGPLSAFLLETLLLEYSMGTGAAAYVSPGQSVVAKVVAQVVAPLERVPFGPMGWPDDGLSWFYAGDDVVVQVQTSVRAAEHHLFIGASSAESLDYVRGIAPDWFWQDRWR